MPKGWGVFRRKVLERDGYRCRECGKAGKLEVHHVKPVYTHPDLELNPSNCISLCVDCHKEVTRREFTAEIPGRAAWRLFVAELD